MEEDMRASSKYGCNQKIFLGNIYGPKFHDLYSGAVFDIHGISSVITTCQGGGREPHILVVDKLERSK